MKFIKYTFTELLEILKEFEAGFCRGDACGKSKKIATLLENIGVQAPNIEEDGSPCSECGDPIDYYEYKGVIIVVKYHYCEEELVYCIALIGDTLKLYRLNTAYAIQYPKSVAVALKYVENSSNGMKLITDDEEVKCYGRGAVAVDTFYLGSFDLGISLDDSILYPEDYGDLDITQFISETEPDDADDCEECEALKDEILLDDDENNMEITTPTRQDSYRNLKLTVSWEEYEESDPLEASDNELYIDTAKGESGHSYNYHYFHDGYVIAIPENIKKSDVICSIVHQIEDYCRQIEVGGTILSEWHES